MEKDPTKDATFVVLRRPWGCSPFSMEFNMSDSSTAVSTTSHPSLAAPTVPGRGRRARRDFSETMSEGGVERTRPRMRGLVSVTADVAGNIGPVGGLVSAGLNALGGGGTSDARTESIDNAWEMQRESQAFNMEYLALQESMQSENRRFTTLSNVMKARHDTAKSAISNIRV